MPANTPTPDQLGLRAALHALNSGANIVAIMDERELNYPVAFTPGDETNPSHIAMLRDSALN